MKNIQDEYQRYMERVRAKAQSAIDQANTAYSQQRTVLMARFDALVTYLSQQQAAAAQQRQQAAAAAQQAIAAAGQQQLQPGGGGAAAAAAGQQAVAAQAQAQLHAGLAKAAAGEGQAAAAAAAAAASNPMHMLSHAMASQLLSLQAGMAQAAAAAGKPGGAAAGAAPAAITPQAAAAAAAAAAAHHPLNAAFAQCCALPEAELRAQVGGAGRAMGVGASLTNTGFGRFPALPAALLAPR